ncbi:MAG: polymorphic toxin-type HINT domain-containing protein, partial [Planctomycetaceae bacterium]
MNRSSRTLVFCSLIGIGLFSLLNALPSSVGTEGVETINKLRAEDWLRNQIGYVVGEKSTPSGERLGLSKNPPSPNQESGPPKAESRASESQTRGLKAAESVSPQTENLQPKTAADPDLWNFGIGHSPLVPLSPLRPIFTEILLTSLAVEEEGAELVGMTVQMDLPELGLTGEAILTDIRSAPAIEPPVDHLDTRQVVTATFHHSSGDVIDLVVADSRSTLPGLPGRTFAADEPQCRAVVPTAQPRNQGVNDWDNRSTEVAASREVLSREDQQEAASDSPLSAFGSPLSPACEVGASNHEPAESEETIGTTSNHPFWSVDRQEFVQAGSLEIGERLQTLSGDVKVVQQKLPHPGPQPVFNLEVHNEHVYFVGEDGVLVHNGNEIYSINQQRGRYG